MVDNSSIKIIFESNPELVEREVNRWTCEPALLKNPKLNCKMNTGHIYKLRHPHKRCNFQLSNAPRNINNGEELVEKSSN